MFSHSPFSNLRRSLPALLLLSFTAPLFAQAAVGQGTLRSVAKDGRSTDAWRTIRFSSGSFRPEPGVDPALAATVSARSIEARNGDVPVVYAFLLADRFLSASSTAVLDDLGIEVLGEHGDAYKVKMPADLTVADTAAALPWVVWIGLPPAEVKIDRELSAEIVAGDETRLPVWINLFDRGSAALEGRLVGRGAELGGFDRDLVAFRAEVSADMILDLASEDAVLFIEPMRTARPHHDQSMALIGADFIRPVAGGGGEPRFDGSSFAVGVMDSGFDLSHIDLAGKEGCGLNFVDDTSIFEDGYRHGSHVLGSLAGAGEAKVELRGVAPGAGTRPGAALFLAKVFDASGASVSGAVENAMEFMHTGITCTSSRPQVVNFSGGSPIPGGVGTDAMSRKLDSVVWDGRQLYVVSAGNDGPEPGTVNSPALAKNALAVGNVLDFGYQLVGDLGPTSSRGPTADGRMKPNVLAPGNLITSVKAGSFVEYRSIAGTSMAAPHVAGLAATLLDHYPSVYSARPQRTRARLMASSLLHDDAVEPRTNLGAGRGGLGLGRVSSVVAHDNHFEPGGWSHVERDGFITTSAFSVSTTVPEAAERLVVVMTWDEPAASAGAAQAVTFDLDLWIDHSANGTCNHPQGACGDFVSQTIRDNTEWIIVDDPPAGHYDIRAVPFHGFTGGLPVAISATVLRGDPRPEMALTVTGTDEVPPVGESFTLTTRVTSPEYIASGVFLDLIENVADQGLRLDQLATVRADNVEAIISAKQLTLGNVPVDGAREATWTFTVLDSSPKSLTFRAWSENGGEIQVVETFGGDGSSAVFADGFEAGDMSAW